MLRRSSPYSGYIIALVATGVALFLRFVLDRWIHDTSRFLFFAPAVMVAAWYGGFGPGMLSTIVSAFLVNYFLMEPVGFSIDPSDMPKIVLFLIVGTQISWLSGALFSAKRHAEADAQAARRSEQLYRTLAHNFPDGAVFLLDYDLRLALAEGQALSEAGLSPQSLRGRYLFDAFPREVRKLIGPLLAAGAKGKAITRELSIGGRVYLVRGLPLGGTAGAMFAGMAIAQDITELARAREALQAAHDELEARVRERTAELLFQKTLLEAQSNASLDGILVVADDSRIIFQNRRLARLWRLPEEAFAGPLATAVSAMRGNLVDPQNPLAEVEGWSARTDSEPPLNLLLRDGRTLECYSAPVRSAEGHSYGRVWYFRDITERRRLTKQILEASERERQRIGQDLHDDLCQHLTGITCLGRVLQQRLESKLPGESESAGHIVDLVEQAIRRARDLAKGLQPVELERGGLGLALQELARTVQGMFPVRCHFRGESFVPLADAAAPIHLYRIAQEAINNAVRHGKAGNVYVDLVQVDGRIILTVEDDGVGIGPAAPKNGLGLRTMRHRARMIGAALSVERANGAGTLITCQLSPHAASQTLLVNGISDA